MTLETPAIAGATTTSFVITGFSRFSGVEDNPTEKLVKWLQEQLEGGVELGVEFGSSVQIVRSTVLPVAAADVDKFFHSLASELACQEGEAPAAEAPVPLAENPARAPDTSSVPPPLVPEAQRGPSGGAIVLLHLGVAHKATEYRLEARAYNCASFRVPDERGWQPAAQELEEGVGLESWVGSRLPLEALRDKLAEKGHNVVVSTDAGRFVCNWTYYRACKVAEQECRGWSSGMHALFVHVPPFTAHGEESQRVFLVDTLRAVAECLASIH